MEKTELKQGRDNKLNLHTLGLKLEVQPYWLVKEMINENSQSILDEVIEVGFRKVLRKYNMWKIRLINEIEKSGENMDDAIERYKYKVHVQEIQDVADYSRHILSLHSDSEFFIGKHSDIEKAVESTYSYWKYNSFYGFETTK